ncbi:MAG TPA: peptidoglycan-binding domain-containing protein [Actinomycetota bacterium]|nr:peptidoglycan-binding domain-containing protein [Actinomycetota bacterium]
MKYEVVDNCPVPRLLARRLRDLKGKVPGATLNSCYRGADAEDLLHRLGKKSQRELYDGYKAGLPGYNPANPPGRSTHELRSDGAAYLGPVGRRLFWWQCGMDWDTEDVDRLIAAGRGFVWELWRPYASGSEAHHLNFRVKPVWKRKKSRDPHPILHAGDEGRAVRRVQHSLNRLGADIDVDGIFGSETIAAVKAFQRERGITVDGVVGPETWREMLKPVKKKKET